MENCHKAENSEPTKASEKMPPRIDEESYFDDEEFEDDYFEPDEEEIQERSANMDSFQNALMKLVR